MADEALKFTFGLINSNDKYLTAEKFNFKIAASASGMKQKQIWSLEQKSDGSEVYFKSYLNKYLGTNKYGVVRCDDDTPGDENGFQVEATSDGRWAIKSALYGRYFGGSDMELDCFGTDIEGKRLWIVHLAMHPQVIQPAIVGQRLRYRRRVQKGYFDKSARNLPALRTGDKVRIQDRTGFLQPATVVRKHESPRSYIVQTKNRQLRRNRRHLLKVPDYDEALSVHSESPDNSITSTASSPVKPTVPTIPQYVTRYGRVCRPNPKYKDYVTHMILYT